MRRLPWYIILENSPLKLGDGPYGLPYVNGQVNPKNTLWAENPKLAMSKTLWNAAEDNATVEPVEKLLKIGADPNFQDPNTKCTPLHLAAMHGNTQLAVLLIQNGGDINKRCNKAGTPIEIAKSYNHEATVSAMLEAAASK